MFTGIIEELGRVRAVEPRGEDARIVIGRALVTEDAHEGDSIAVNGVCLTALDVSRIPSPRTCRAKRSIAPRSDDCNRARL